MCHKFEEEEKMYENNLTDVFTGTFQNGCEDGIGIGDTIEYMIFALEPHDILRKDTLSLRYSNCLNKTSSIQLI